MKKGKKIFLWCLAFILTMIMMIYQRKTGPTYPVAGEEQVFDSMVSYEFLRTFIAHKELPVSIKTDQNDLKAFLYHRVYKSDSQWTEVEMIQEESVLKAMIPGLPSAGKVEYRIMIKRDGQDKFLYSGRSIVARFREEVPTWLLILHILFMIISMMLAFRTGFEVFQKEPQLKRLIIVTLVSIFIGGFILGPLMQKYAFGALWTGFPFGYDLTDNKILLAFIFWVVAFFLRKKSKWWVLAAAILMMAVYLIPHSVLGSELDPKSGKMKNVFGRIDPLKNHDKNQFVFTR